MKVVINGCYGGFSISRKCAEHMAASGSERARRELDSVKSDGPLAGHFYGYGYVDGLEGGYDRSDPLLVAAVEALGADANGTCAELRVIRIPDGTDYEIDEYDGMEHIAEKHRTWR